MTIQPPDNDDTNDQRMLGLELVGNVVCSTKIGDYLTAIGIEELRAELVAAHGRHSRLLDQPAWLRGGAGFRCAEISGWRHRLLAGMVPDTRRGSLLQTRQPKPDWVDGELPLLAELRSRFRLAWEATLNTHMASVKPPSPIDDPSWAETPDRHEAPPTAPLA